MEMSIIEKCVSYIDNKPCQNNRDGGNWCNGCAKKLYPIYIKYKKIEEKYYVNKFEEDITLEKLIYMRDKIAHAISLRYEIQNRGYAPEFHDIGHEHRIKNLEKYIENIDHMIIGKNKTPSLHITESEEPTPTKKIQVKDRKKDKKKQTDISSQEIELLNKFFRIQNADYILYKITMDLLDNAEKFLLPKFGKYFVRNFILQQEALSLICFHWVDQFCKKTYKPHKYGRNKMISLISEVAKHRFMTFEEIMISLSYKLLEGKNIIKEGDGHKNQVNNKLLNYMTILYEYIPQIPLPEYIKSIDFTVDTSFDTTNLSIDLGEKYELIKSRKIRNIASLNNCLHMLKITDIDIGEYLGIQIEKSAKPNHISIRTVKLNGENIVDATPYSDIDMVDYRCNCTTSAIFNLDGEKINQDDIDNIMNLGSEYTSYIFRYR